jgi:hypothetical protein
LETSTSAKYIWTSSTISLWVTGGVVSTLSSSKLMNGTNSAFPAGTLQASRIAVPPVSPARKKTGPDGSFPSAQNAPVGSSAGFRQVGPNGKS